MRIGEEIRHKMTTVLLITGRDNNDYVDKKIRSNPKKEEACESSGERIVK